MTNPTEPAAAKSAAEQAAIASQLLTLVSEMRGLRDRASQLSGKPTTFAEIAHATLAGQNDLTPRFHRYLREIAEILDSHDPKDVDSKLAADWRAAVQAWMQPRL